MPWKSREQRFQKAVGKCANRRTEENRLDSKTSAEAEAQSQAVMEWEEDGETDAVGADDSVQGS